ncbi:aminoglycoside phosphotransferase family protein [Chlamydiota bacterium]
MPVIDSHYFRKEMGEDLLILMQKFDSQVVRVEPITTLFSPYLERGVFKLILADGRILKARRFPRPEEAHNMMRLSLFLEMRYFPRGLLFHGRGVFIEWIEGKSFNVLEDKIDIVQEGGKIQGILHATSLPEELYEQSHSEYHYWKNRLEKKISYLVEHGFLRYPEGKRLFKAASIYQEQSLSLGLIHGDFCVENMIINTQNEISVIDIESISVTALAYDIARTTLRWKMNSQQHERFLNSYVMVSIFEEFLKGFSFWIILVLVESAIFYVQGRMVHLRNALVQLRKIQYMNEKTLRRQYGYY